MPEGAAAPVVRWWRRRIVVAGVAVIVVGAGAFVAIRVTSSPSAPAAASTSTQTTTIIRTDVHQTTPVDGTIGYAGSYTIIVPAGNPSSALTHDQQAVTTAEQAVASDRTTMADTATADDQSVAAAKQSLQAADATRAADQTQLQEDQATLSADQAKESNDCQGDASAGSSGSGGGGGSGDSGSAGSQCSADQAKVATDQTKVSQDDQTAAKDDQAVQSALTAISSAQQKAAQDADTGRTRLSADQASLSQAQASLATDGAAVTSYDQNSKYTALPAVGQVVRFGQSLWSVDGQPVPLLPGVLAPWRTFAGGMSPGPDVAVLDRALAQLGYGGGLSGSDSFTGATAAAIDRLQGSLGLPRTGALDLGAAVFEPTPVRVTTVNPQLGANVMGGAPVLTVTSTTSVINLALPVNQSYLVAVGDAVTATLPDGTTAPGTITAVGTVATSSSGSGGNGNNEPSATVNVTVALSQASPAGSLDQAPVTVNITNNSATGVLAVPTTALLALAGGGYAVEVVNPDGTHQLVAVTTGIFDDSSGMVQISGSGLAAGQKVVVPSS